MHYRVKDDEFHPKDYKNSQLNALNAAIRLAVEYGQVEPVDVFKVDETGVHVAYKVDKQPIRKQRQGNYWKEKQNG